MSHEDVRKEGAESPETKLSYQQPRFFLYGRVRDLTQNGSGLSTEATTGGGGCSADLTRMSCLSDRQTKMNIARIGTHPFGLGLYLFEYKPEYRDAWGHCRQFGVMADEVEQVMPNAVSLHPDGYKMVDYAMLGISRSLH